MGGISSIGGRRWGVLLGALSLAFALAARAEVVRTVEPTKPAPGGERRTALVIGNSAYKSSPLRNPVNDARAMTRVLADTGFQVIVVEDAGRATMRRVIRDWGDQLARGGVGLFYFAGHGMQIRGRNYLIPVTADVQREDEVEDESVDVNTVLSKMETAKNQLNLLVLDACRNNPFQRAFRSAAQGLAQMDAPTGTLISFATAPGSVAADGTGENGLYTQHLLKAILTPGLPIEQLFKQVRIGVTKDTGDKQVPWESSSLRGDFFFLPPVPGSQLNQADVNKAVQEATKAAEARAAQERTALQSAMEKMIADALAKQKAQLDAERKGAAPVPAPAPASASAPAPARNDDRQIELAFWDSIKGSTNVVDFTAYLERYPQGAFAPIARTRVQQLGAAADIKTATAPSKPAPAPVAAATAAPATASTPPVQVASVAAVPASAPPAEGRWQYAGAESGNADRRFEHVLELQGRSPAGTLELFVTKQSGGSPWVYTAVPTLVGHPNGWSMFSPLVSGEPIEVGKTWNNVAVERVESCGRGLLICNAAAAVVAREKVATKAGTFDTVRVKVTVTLRANAATALREMEFWYSSEVGRPVKYAMRTFGGSGYQMNLTDPNVIYELAAFMAGGRSAGIIDQALANAGTATTPAPILVASASPTPGAIRMQGPAVPKVGDRWEYEYRDLSNNRTQRQRIDVGTVGADGILENVVIDGGGSVTLQHGPGAYLSGAGLLQFSPYLQAFGALEASLGGEIAVTRLADCEGMRTCAVKARVAGRERITVAAGSFEATRVDVVVTVVNGGTSYATMRNATVELSIWYAPEVRRAVRATGTVFGPAALMSNFETTLQSYKVQ